MSKNKIQQFRRKKGLSQKRLAELVGTSQQQIQRIEKGKQASRFDIAVKICSVLQHPMEIVFPETKGAIQTWKKKGGDMRSLQNDREIVEPMEEADIDMEGVAWFFKYRLRGNTNGILPISSKDKERLWGAVQRTDSSTFVLFDSEHRRILLNLDHLIFCHFLFDAPKEDEDEQDELVVFLADGGEELRFEVEPEDAPTDASEDMGDLHHMMYMAENLPERDSYAFHFIDVDGETVFLPSKDVAMIQIPLWAVEPELLDNEEDESTLSETDGTDPVGNA